MPSTGAGSAASRAAIDANRMTERGATASARALMSAGTFGGTPVRSGYGSPWIGSFAIGGLLGHRVRLGVVGGDRHRRGRGNDDRPSVGGQPQRGDDLLERQRG